jgi:hypothetical protein
MMILTIFALILSAGSIAFGQETGKDRFATKDACKAAIKARSFSNYNPSFLNNHREPRDGEEIRPLEERACINLHIVGGRGFVPQAKGTLYIFRGTQIVARYDCGNDATEIEYVPVEVVEINLPVYLDFTLLELVEFSLTTIPPLPALPPEGEAAILVYDEHGKCWVWKYTPLWCVDVRRPRDLYKPLVCAAAAAAIYYVLPSGAVVKMAVALVRH